MGLAASTEEKKSKSSNSAAAVGGHAADVEEVVELAAGLSIPQVSQAPYKSNTVTLIGSPLALVPRGGLAMEATDDEALEVVSKEEGQTLQRQT